MPETGVPGRRGRAGGPLHTQLTLMDASRVDVYLLETPRDGTRTFGRRVPPSADTVEAFPDKWGQT